MAIFHLSVKLISRSKGRSAVAAAAYRHGLRMADERTGLLHDYRAKQGIEHSQILTPPGTPGWAQDRSILWNKVERREKRRDAQLAREVEIALPAELSPAQRLALIRHWIKAELTDRGMIADLALHAPGGEGDNRNFHAHIMTTLRPVEGQEFGQKNRHWGNREMLRQWRRSWAESCNEHLAAAGSPERIDHRTLRARGIDRQPTIKRGQRATAIDRRAGKTISERGALNQAIHSQNRRRRQGRLQQVRWLRARWENMAELAHDALHDLVRVDGGEAMKPEALDQILETDGPVR
ncbi:MAG TPA: MobQ family relaxase [Terriglobia bacterium]|nr:MobQ family relaxase [Terriglobia bacterium]